MLFRSIYDKGRRYLVVALWQADRAASGVVYGVDGRLNGQGVVGDAVANLGERRRAAGDDPEENENGARDCNPPHNPSAGAFPA